MLHVECGSLFNLNDILLPKTFSWLLTNSNKTQENPDAHML